MRETFEQQVADGSVCKLWNYFTQSVQSHKPGIVREMSVLQYNAKQDLILISKNIFFHILVN